MKSRLRKDSMWVGWTSLGWTVRMLAVGLVLVGVCMVAPAVAGQSTQDVELVWPAPPDPARIKYVGYLKSERDIGKNASVSGRLKRALLGSKQEATILNRPHAVYVDPAGRIYVTDRAGGGRLVRFDPKKKKVDVIAPEGIGRLVKPFGISGDAAGHIYVADPPSRRVVALDADGEFLQAYGGTDVLLNPVDVGVTASGDRVYVVDSYLHQVVIFDSDGKLIRRVGKDVVDPSEKLSRSERRKKAAQEREMQGHPVRSEPSDIVENRSPDEGEFRYPAFIAVEADTVYVSDSMNFRIQVFDRDGEFVRQISQLGSAPGSLARPKGLGVDSEGHIYIADAAFNNVQVFDRTGNLLLAFGDVGPGRGEFWQPMGMNVAGDRIYVVDRFNNRIQIFNYLQVADAPSVEKTEEETTASSGER